MLWAGAHPDAETSIPDHLRVLSKYRPWIRAFSIIILALLTFPSIADTTLAQTASVQMSIVAGFDGKYVGDWPIPVEAEIDAVRAFAGKLWVRSISPQGGQSVWEMPIEVPAGGRKVFRMLVNPGTQLFAGIERDGKNLISRGVNLAKTNELLVGFLGAPLPEGLAALQRDAAQSPLRAFPLAPQWLSRGSSALQHLGYLVMDPSTSGSLNKTQSNALLSWVAEGGRLIIGSDNPNPVAWLPESWKLLTQNGSTQIIKSGLGQVIFAPPFEQIASDQAAWLSLIRPYGRSFATGQDFIQDPRLSVAGILSSTSRDPVRLPWVAVFLIGYVVVIGPVAYLVVRTIGRKELMWVIVPIGALVFSVFGFIVARGNRGEELARQANVVFASAEHNTGQRIAVTSSGSGKERRIGFKTPYSRSLATGGRPTGNSSTVARNSGSETVFVLTPFEIGAATGPIVDANGHLDASLTWDGTGFHGSVTNRTKFEFSDVQLIMGGNSVSVGTIHAGGQAAMSILPRGPDQRPNIGQQLAMASSNPYMYGNTMAPAATNLGPALAASLYRQLGIEPILAPPIVAGITDDYRPSLSLDGRSVSPPGFSLFASQVALDLPRDISGVISPASGHGRLIATQSLSGSQSQSMSMGRFSSQGAPVISGPGESIFLWQLPDALSGRTFESPKLWIGVDFPGSSPQFMPPQQSGATPNPLGGLRFEVFDWTTSQWKTFQSPTAGSSSHDIPLGAINSAGETLIRFAPGTLLLELWSLGLEVEVL